MDEYLKEMLNSAKDNLNLFCGGNTKEINKILAASGYYIDILELSKLKVKGSIIKKVSENNEAK